MAHSQNWFGLLPSPPRLDKPMSPPHKTNFADLQSIQPLSAVRWSPTSPLSRELAGNNQAVVSYRGMQTDWPLNANPSTLAHASQIYVGHNGPAAQSQRAKSDNTINRHKERDVYKMAVRTRRNRGYFGEPG